MKKLVGMCKYLLSAIMLVTLLAANALAVDVSGTVSYSGSNTGRVFLTLQSQYGNQGTSIASPGAFTIKGVPTGAYVIQAFMDAKNTGTRHASDPAGSSSAITVTTTAVSGVTVSLTDPAQLTTVPSPMNLHVYPGNGMAMVGWDYVNSGNAEQADGYGLYWSTSSDVMGTYGTLGGSKVAIPATADNKEIVFLSGLTNGAQLYFAMVAKSGTVTSLPSTTVGPITIGAPVGGSSVSGTVSFPSLSVPVDVPLTVLVVDDSSNGATQFYFASIAAPLTSPVSYTINGVPNGSYKVFAFLDMNKSGQFDSGDIMTNESTTPAISVSGSALTNINVPLSSVDASAEVRTNHWKNGSSEGYVLNYDISEGVKRPVAVTLVSGPNAPGTIDIGLDSRGSFRCWIGTGASVPVVGDTYQFNVSYSDNSTGTLTAAVTGVVNSFATPTAPVGTQTYNSAPVFIWTTPTPPPAGSYNYSVYLNEQGGNLNWDSNQIASTQSSANFNFDGRANQQTLTDGKTYNWSIMVSDSLSNYSMNGTSFTNGAPSLNITSSSLQSATVMNYYYQSLYASGGSGSYTWSVQSGSLPSGMTLDSVNGVISGSPSSVGTSIFTISVFDSGTATTATKSFIIPVNAVSPLTISTTTLQTAVVNAYYSQLIYFYGGTGPYNFSVSGSLPPGISFSTNNGNGWLYGTATATGDYPITITVTDSLAASYSQSFILSVSSATTTISGSVSYSGTKTGRIYITVDTNYGRLGTSISGTGAYSIRGVPSGSYKVNAFMDSANLLAQVHSSPVGSVTVTSTGSNTTANILLSDTAVAAPAAPTNLGAAPSDSSVLIGWDRAKDANGVESADGYTVYWNTSTPVSKSNNIGSRSIPAGMDSPPLIEGLTNGTNYYFIVIPNSAGVDGTPTAVFGPVTVGATTGGNTVSGTVNYSGPTATGPLYVAVVQKQNKGMGNVYYTKFTNPATSQSFSISGIANGTYEVYATYDMNNDKLFGTGDVDQTGDNAPVVTLTGSGASGVLVSLVSSNSNVTISTDHGKQVSSTSDWYRVSGNVRGQLKRPVAVALTGAPSTSGISFPLDLGMDYGEIRFGSSVLVRPATGEVYSFTITYSDGTTEVVSPQVTGVLDSFPTNPAVSGAPVSTVPTFTWGAPASPPASYTYELWIGGTNNNNSLSLPSSQLSAVYGADGQSSPLQLNTQYNWNISTRDLNDNKATLTSYFTPTIASISISGAVKDSSGAGAIPYAQVYVYNAATGGQVSSVSADVNGIYTVAGLPTGNYKLKFSSSAYLTQYYNNKATMALSDPVSVVLGTATANINASLALGGKISGAVTNGSTPIPNIYVSVWDGVTGAFVSSATADTSGNYLVQGLPSGNYKVKFVDFAQGYINQWYNGKTKSSADLVSVTAGATTTSINAALLQGGSISGRVVNVSSTGITSGYIYAYDAVTEINDPDAAVMPDSSGNYTIKGLATGSYKVQISSKGYLTQWYNNKSSISTADPVSVSVGTTTPLSATTLLEGGKISGTVTNAAGAVLPGISVIVYDAITNIIPSNASASTDASGNYTIAGLQTGSYKVRFNNIGSSNSYITVWNSNKPSTATADSIAVTAGATTSGVNATLATGGTISGQLTDGTTGIASISVFAFNSFDENIASATTGISGNFTIKGLPDGSYKLRFQEQPSSSTYSAVGYVYQVYTNPNINSIYLSQGTLIPVTAASPATGINAVLVKGAGSISGTITDAATGAVLYGAAARVTDLSGGYLGGANTDANGNYTVKGIPTGTYKVEFIMTGKYAHQWYTAKGDFASATAVSVTAPGDTAAINAALLSGPSIQLSTVIRGYNNVILGSTSTRTFTLYSHGTTDLTIGTLSIVGADFSLLNDRCSGKTLPPTGNCTIQVSFTPTSAGAISATVNIPSNDPETPTIGMVAKGTGVVPAGSDVTPPSLVSSSPINNAADVSISSTISITFSEAVKGMPDLTAAVKNNATGLYVAGVGSSSADNLTQIFTPGSPLSPGTTYSILLATVTDMAGNPLPVTTLTFTTAAAAPTDTTPPVTTATPAGGLFGAAQSVTLSASEAATIYYTVDGSTPSIASPVYSTPIAISSTTTLQYFAKDSAGNSETVKAVVFTIDATIPVTTASLAGGLFNSAQSVTLTVNKSATIYYTTDGSIPTTISTVYSSPITISATTTLKFFSKDSAGNSESVKTIVYTIDASIPTTTVSPAGGVFSLAQSVTLSANETAIIYYTTDGSVPTTSSPVYSTPISISATTSLKFFSKDSAGNSETVKTVLYTILPNGDINGDGKIDISDAYRALEMAVGRVQATAADLKNGDVAPLVNGKPSQDGAIDVADVVVMLRKIVGLVNW